MTSPEENALALLTLSSQLLMWVVFEQVRGNYLAWGRPAASAAESEAPKLLAAGPTFASTLAEAVRILEREAQGAPGA